MSKKALRVCMVAILSIGLFMGGSRSAVADESSDAFAFYLEFLKTAAAADTLDDIAGFMPSWWRERYGSADEARKASTLARKKDIAGDLLEVALEKGEVVDDGVRLHMTAKEKNGFPMRGEILLVVDGGSFVVEEEKWATSQ